MATIINIQEHLEQKERQSNQLLSLTEQQVRAYPEFTNATDEEVLHMLSGYLVNFVSWASILFPLHSPLIPLIHQAFCNKIFCFYLVSMIMICVSKNLWLEQKKNY